LPPLSTSTYAGSWCRRSCTRASRSSFAAPFLGLFFVQLSIILHVTFAVGVLLFIIVIERPMKANFKVGPLELANAFLAHLSEGSKKLDDFFRSIGESVVGARGLARVCPRRKEEIFL